MDAKFKLLASGFVDKGGTVDGIFLEFSGKRNGTNHVGVVALGGFNNLAARVVNQAVVVTAYPQAEKFSLTFFWGHTI